MRHKDGSKHDAILNATIQLITTEGIANTSMSKIAKEANISPATIYIYFEGKNDLLNKLYISMSKNLGDTIFDGLNEEIRVKENVRLIWKNARRYSLSNPLIFPSFEQLIHSPLISRSNKEQGQRILLPLFELIERGKTEDMLQDISMAVCIAIIYSPLISLIDCHRDDGIVLTEAVTMSTFEMCWKAIQK